MTNTMYTRGPDDGLYHLDQKLWDFVRLDQGERSPFHLIHAAAGDSSEDLTLAEAVEFITHQADSWNLAPALRDPHKLLAYARRTIDAQFDQTALTTAHYIEQTYTEPHWIATDQSTDDTWPLSTRFAPVEQQRTLTHAPRNPALLVQDIRTPHTAEDDLNADLIHFWNTLVGIVPLTNWKPPQDRATRVVDVGCGKAASALPISAYFGGLAQLSLAQGSAQYVGIDIDRDSITWAQQNWGAHAGDHISFLVADATQFDATPALQKDFDVIVIRHQEIGNNYRVWARIMMESYEHLAVGGLLFITSYGSVEYEHMRQAMQVTNATPLVSGRNPYSGKTNWHCSGRTDICLSDLYWYRDSYVAAYTKPEPTPEHARARATQ